MTVLLLHPILALAYLCYYFAAFKRTCHLQNASHTLFQKTHIDDKEVAVSDRSITVFSSVAENPKIQFDNN